MKAYLLRPAGAQDAGPDEQEFPLPVADPSVRPMHRECVLKGCSYQSRFLFGAGWVLALIFLVAALAIGLYGALSQEALLKEIALLHQRIHAQRAQSVTRSPTPVVPAEKEPLVAPPPSPPSKAVPQARKSVPPKKPKEYPPVPESDLRGVASATRLPASDVFLPSIRPDDQKE